MNDTEENEIREEKVRYGEKQEAGEVGKVKKGKKVRYINPGLTWS